MSSSDWEKTQVRNGMRRMLALRSELMDRGERMIGWKLALGAPLWLDRFGLAGPLLGFLPESRRHAPGAKVSCDGWRNPVAEPEIAVYFGRDVDVPENAADAVTGLGAAIELADVDPPPQDIEETLAGNIFHRAVILGEPDPALSIADVSSMSAKVSHDDVVVAETTDLQALIGDLPFVLAHAATLLSSAGHRLRAGDVVITGSVIPPVTVRPGSEIGFELQALPSLTVRV